MKKSMIIKDSPKERKETKKILAKLSQKQLDEGFNGFDRFIYEQERKQTKKKK